MTPPTCVLSERRSPLSAGDAEILTQEALALVAMMNRVHDSARWALLARRVERAARLRAGERPALLWELDRHDEDAAVVLTCPGLDPSWRTTEPRGEALLAAPAEVPSRATVPGADEGDSFG